MEHTFDFDHDTPDTPYSAQGNVQADPTYPLAAQDPGSTHGEFGMGLELDADSHRQRMHEDGGAAGSTLRGHDFRTDMMPPYYSRAVYHPAEQKQRMYLDTAQPGHDPLPHSRMLAGYDPLVDPMSAQQRNAPLQVSSLSVAPPETSAKMEPACTKRARDEKASTTSGDTTSSKRSRAEKHYKEIHLLCNALAPHIADVNCLERALRMYDKYRESGKAAGRPSRPMYAAVVLAMSGEEDEEGDESECKQRLPLLANASAQVWGGDAPDKRKIWDSLVVLLRIVPLRLPQDNLAGSVLMRLFRSMRFSSKQEEEDSTKRDLIKLATTLEQGPLAGKAPKTVAACTMHLYCRHTQVGLSVARTIANSLQVGESTVRTNLRSIYVGGGGGTGGSQVLSSKDAQDILESLPHPSGFKLNLPGSAASAVSESAGAGTGAGAVEGGDGSKGWGKVSKVMHAVQVDEGAGAGVRGGGGIAEQEEQGEMAEGECGRGWGGNYGAQAMRETLFPGPPPLVSTPTINAGRASYPGPAYQNTGTAFYPYPARPQAYHHAAYPGAAGVCEPQGVGFGMGRAGPGPDTYERAMVDLYRIHQLYDGTEASEYPHDYDRAGTY